MSNPTVQQMTIPEHAAAYAAAEIARVKRAVAGSLEPHPLRGMDPAVWEYMADLMLHAFQCGAARGQEDNTRDMNLRYTMRPRAVTPGDGVPIAPMSLR